MWHRLRRVLSGKSARTALDPDRPDLVVVAESFDPSESCSSVLERAAKVDPQWQEKDPAVLRHHLSFSEIPAEAVEIAALDGYSIATSRPVPSPVRAHINSCDQHVVLQRVQVLSALSCAQEAARMASLTSRLGGTCYGWDALQPPLGAAQRARFGY